MYTITLQALVHENQSFARFPWVCHCGRYFLILGVDLFYFVSFSRIIRSSIGFILEVFHFLLTVRTRLLHFVFHVFGEMFTTNSHNILLGENSDLFPWQVTKTYLNHLLVVADYYSGHTHNSDGSV